jgi:hypothetical protein
LLACLHANSLLQDFQTLLHCLECPALRRCHSVGDGRFAAQDRITPEPQIKRPADSGEFLYWPLVVRLPL